MRAQTKAKVEEAMQEEDRPQPKRPKVHAQTVVREKPAAKSTGPLGNARPRAKVRRAAAPEWSHVRAGVWLCTKRRKVPNGRRVHPQDSSEDSSSEDDVTAV